MALLLCNLNIDAEEVHCRHSFLTLAELQGPIHSLSDKGKKKH